MPEGDSDLHWHYRPLMPQDAFGVTVSLLGLLLLVWVNWRRRPPGAAHAL